jgi:hypothetical protein
MIDAKLCFFRFPISLFSNQICINTKMNSSESQPHFGPPIKIHETDLVDPATLRLNLDRTSIPQGLSGRCNLSLILDPLNGCPDQNLTNNILEFPVIVNGSTSTSVSGEKSCKVIPDFASNGKSNILSFYKNIKIRLAFVFV